MLITCAKQEIAAQVRLKLRLGHGCLPDVPESPFGIRGKRIGKGTALECAAFPCWNASRVILMERRARVKEMGTEKIRNDIADTAASLKAGAGDAFERARQVGSEALAQGQETLSRVAGQAADIAEAARREASVHAEAAKGTLADSGQRIASTLRDAAAGQDTNSVNGKVMAAVAGGIDEISESLRGHSIGTLMSEAQDLARRNPAIFVLGAALAGFALARLTRAGADSGAVR